MKIGKIIGQGILLLMSLAYPFVWYFGREMGLFIWLAMAMCGLWLFRAFLQKNQAQKVISICVAVFFAVVGILRLPDSMYWYPVMVSLLMFMMFFGSLWTKQSMIERLARLQDPDLPPEGVRYTRRVTQIWCVFFVVNILIATILILLEKYDWWAIYTGIIAYILMGLLFVGEWVYRKWVLKV